MTQIKWEYQGETGGKTTRRRFLKGAAALAATAPALARAGVGPNKSATSPPRPILAYVATYSSPQGPEGAQGRGRGIYLVEMNPATGTLEQREVFPNDGNPACLAFDPSRTHLYSANEVSGFQGTNSGSISAYAIDRASGHLTLLNVVSSEGAGGPAHISIHPSGKFALAANYRGGTVAVLPIRANGELGPATDVIENEGTPGPDHADQCAPGKFRHQRPRAPARAHDPE